MSEANWVLARARCTAGHYLDKLVQTIRQDVNRFNGLEAARERRQGFTVKPGRDGAIEVHRAKLVHYADGNQEWETVSGPIPDFVAVGCSGSVIQAARADHWNIEIDLRWNIESLSCDMILDGEIRSVPYICQKILGEFMFEDLAL